MKILIVDDEQQNSIPLNNALLQEGYEVVMVDNVRDAIESIHTQKIDIIVSDLNMPYLSGFDLLSSVRKEDSKTPFIMYTRSDSRWGLGELAAISGVSKFIPNATLKEIYGTVKERVLKAINDNNAATLSA